MYIRTYVHTYILYIPYILYILYVPGAKLAKIAKLGKIPAAPWDLGPTAEGPGGGRPQRVPVKRINYKYKT